MEQETIEATDDEPPSGCQYILHKDLSYRHLFLVAIILLTFGTLSLYNGYVSLLQHNFINILGLRLSILFSVSIVICCIL